MNVTTITATGDRPAAFELCEFYLKRQTVAPFQMLVLDDGEVATTPTLGQDYHYWPEMRGRGSMVKKIRRALNDGLIKGDAIIFAEDDDFMSSDYVAWHIAGLKRFALFGEGRALYYNVTQRWWFEHVNMKHASLCATSLTKALYPWLLKQCTISDEPFLDVRLWNNAPASSHVVDPYAHASRLRRSVGIKGMPGRIGYGGGHRGRDRSAALDTELVKLRSLIGAEADLYAKFYKPETAPLPPEHNAHIPPSKMITNIARSECGRVHGPNWLAWLGHLRGEKIVGMEIGTFEGDSAEWFLTNICTHGDSRFHCVDPFTGSIEHRVHGINVTQLEQTARNKLAKYPNVTIHKAYSQDVLRDWKGKLDFIYIDGSHSTRDVLRDAVLACDLLKVGGVGIFDDYTWGAMPNELDRPKTGIDAFMKCYGKQVRMLMPRASQLAFKKIAE